jgi:hypothetical protein
MIKKNDFRKKMLDYLIMSPNSHIIPEKDLISLIELMEFRFNLPLLNEFETEMEEKNP